MHILVRQLPPPLIHVRIALRIKFFVCVPPVNAIPASTPQQVDPMSVSCDDLGCHAPCPWGGNTALKLPRGSRHTAAIQHEMMKATLTPKRQLS